VRKLLNNGDTIVEVLVALTVLAAIIGSSYAVANRAFRQSQKSQERIQATKLAESQLDLLKFLADQQKIPASIQLADTEGCLYKHMVGTEQVVDFIINDPNDPTTNCWSNELYNYYFSGYDVSRSQYRLSVIWDSYGDAGQEQITMYYRVK
jgi:type II secretory pathway pseudopilin PulG